jgi:hypothetical protein
MAHLEHRLARLELLAGGRKLGQGEAELLRNQLAARIIGPAASNRARRGADLPDRHYPDAGAAK